MQGTLFHSGLLALPTDLPSHHQPNLQLRFSNCSLLFLSPSRRWLQNNTALEPGCISSIYIKSALCLTEWLLNTRITWFLNPNHFRCCVYGPAMWSLGALFVFLLVFQVCIQLNSPVLKIHKIIHNSTLPKKEITGLFYIQISYLASAEYALDTWFIIQNSPIPPLKGGKRENPPLESFPLRFHLTGSLTGNDTSMPST